ncbi:MAG: hypothetical protein IKN04_17915 [Clostridia bacterium]|nr:hypothetical protein [Clostridia bacterium]
MAFISAYSLTEARSLLALYKEAEIALVDGQAKSYKIGTREFTALDLPVILQRIRELAKTIEGLEGNMRTKRAVMVVPRDL